MSRINVIQYEQASGELKNMYDEIIGKRGRLSEVLKIQSLHPASIQSHMQLYLDIMFSQSPVSRAEREMIAVVVSTANGCGYCQVHHSAALHNYWKDENRLHVFIENYQNARLSVRELAMCKFAFHLTKEPQAHANTDFTQNLKNEGLDDRSVLDVVLVTAYFNFVNRMVLGLGVDLEHEQGAGFKY